MLSNQHPVTKGYLHTDGYAGYHSMPDSITVVGCWVHLHRKFDEAIRSLSNYLKDGRLEISNNRAERSIKPFVIDRKNLLFANTPKGAVGSAVIFTLIQTAIEDGSDP